MYESEIDKQRRLQSFGNTINTPQKKGGNKQRTKSPFRSPKPQPPPRPTQFRAQEVGQKVAIAIDVQNLYHGAKSLYHSKIAYREFVAKILNGRTLIRSVAYVATKQGNNQSSFLNLLRSASCDVKEKQVIERGGSFKCNWGVEIAIDAMLISKKIDTFILASGDGNFTYMLEALKMNGIRTEVISFRENTSAALIDVADSYNNIGTDMLMRRGGRKPEPEPEPETIEDSETEEQDETEEVLQECGAMADALIDAADAVAVAEDEDWYEEEE